MGLELELDYRLRWMDFDRYGRMQPTAILDIFQDVATIHADQIGIGRDDMIAQGIFWAVVRTRYEIVQEPQHHQVVTARTWPHTPSRFSFLRDYTMSDQDGNLLVRASSEWVFMDIESRKFVTMKDHYHGPTDYNEDRVFERKPRKAPTFEEGNRPAFFVTPAYSDLDVNGHVNNAKYAGFVIDALAPGSGNRMKSMQIDYRQEVLPGSPLAVHTLVEDERILAKGVREDGLTAFTTLIELR